MGEAVASTPVRTLQMIANRWLFSVAFILFFFFFLPIGLYVSHLLHDVISLSWPIKKEKKKTHHFKFELQSYPSNLSAAWQLT